jgi:Flp pilus assembly pilin Flp
MVLLREERGSALTEYALILVLVFLVVIAIVAVYGVFIGNLYSRVTNQVP